MEKQKILSVLGAMTEKNDHAQVGNSLPWCQTKAEGRGRNHLFSEQEEIKQDKLIQELFGPLPAQDPGATGLLHQLFHSLSSLSHQNHSGRLAYSLLGWVPQV